VAKVLLHLQKVVPVEIPEVPKEGDVIEHGGDSYNVMQATPHGQIMVGPDAEWSVLCVHNGEILRFRRQDGTLKG